MRTRSEQVSWAEANAASPQKPPCFERQADWVAYLRDVQMTAGRASSRPFAASKNPVTYRPDFNFCRDCTADHAHRMRTVGQCHPLHFVPKVES